eukprot:185649-Pelagomonas_calceolata.AAC.1
MDEGSCQVGLLLLSCLSESHHWDAVSHKKKRWERLSVHALRRPTPRRLSEHYLEEAFLAEACQARKGESQEGGSS